MSDAWTGPTRPSPSPTGMPRACARSTISPIPKHRCPSIRPASRAIRFQRTIAISRHCGRAASMCRWPWTARAWKLPACSGWCCRRNDLTPLGGLAVLAQRAAQDFADVGLWQLAAELDVLRPLVAGELAPAMLENILLGEVRVLLDHVDLRHFARVRVGHADHGALEHAGVHRHHLLDLVRENLEAGDDDHVLLAVNDADEAFR